MAKVFDDILLSGIRAGQVPAKTQAARDWYRNAASNVRNTKVTERKMLTQTKNENLETTFRLGHMYMFSYDPKHKKTLPYYDRFPLIFPINTAKGGFLGLNMHYLPPTLRARLMDQLYQTATNKNYNESTKLKISYDILNGASRFRLFKPTVKHYLNNQIRSKLIYINPNEWDIALFLPTQKFVGASRKQVYNDSRKILQGR
jgi:hypothetical protein